MGLKKVRIGLIGLGEMGKIHLLNLRHMKAAEVIAVADVSEKALLKAKEIGVKHTSKDYADLLKNPEVDAVVISLPTFLHAEAAINAAEKGKSLLVEKPIAGNVSDAERVLSCARANGVKLMVGYPLRFSIPFTMLKDKIEQGVLGDVQLATMVHVGSGPFFSRAETAHTPKPVPSWWFDKKCTGGGALMDLGVHGINLLKWYFGDVQDVWSYLGHRFNLDLEDHATCILKFKNGTIGVLNVGWFARYHEMRVDLQGTVDQAYATSKPPSMYYYVKRLFTPIDSSTGFFRELDYFANCIISDVTPSPSGEEGVEDLRTISAAYGNVTDKERGLGVQL